MKLKTSFIIKWFKQGHSKGVFEISCSQPIDNYKNRHLKSVHHSVTLETPCTCSFSVFILCFQLKKKKKEPKRPQRLLKMCSENLERNSDTRHP